MSALKDIFLPLPLRARVATAPVVTASPERCDSAPGAKPCSINPQSPTGGPVVVGGQIIAQGGKMTWKKSRAVARLSAVISVIAGLGVFATPAVATSGGQQVSGTTLSELSLTPGPAAAFTTNFSPGNVASASSSLTATDTSPSWTLTVQDNGTGAGKMVAGATGCTNSEATLQNPLAVDVTSSLGGVTSAGSVSLSGSAQTVASATAAPLAATVFTTAYSQTILSSEAMVTGCVYSLTATYTLQ
jgi:hypothetical protein